MKKLPITFKVGTRGSALAINQSRFALSKMQKMIGGINFKLVEYQTSGDYEKNLDLRETPDDFFVREINQGIIDKEIDFGIHSAKDLPETIKEEIDWFWLPWKEKPNDVIVIRKNMILSDLPKNMKIGISSDRRAEYCKKKFPDALQKTIRGNIESRLSQLDNGDFDLIILAEAGLNRLGLEERIHTIIPIDELKPPDGQGYLAITFRHDNYQIKKIRSLYTSSVIFAGAGVGNKDLCTSATINALNNCNICLYDSLMDHKLLGELPSDAEAIDVGKRCGAHSKQQHITTNLLCERVRRGKKVVRLKGGDPGIFGRLSEETEAIENLNISYRVIPGISAMQAATTGSGMLLTRRDVSRGFVALTPRAAAGKLASCNAEEKSKLPIIYYMSLRAMEHITEELLMDGYNMNTPCAVIYNAGGSDEEIIRVSLKSLPQLGKNHCTTKPGLIIVGDVVSYKYNTSNGALEGKKVLLTCSETLQNKAQNFVYQYGGKPISFPLIDLKYRSDFEHDITDYNWIAVSSPSSAKALMDYVVNKKIDYRKIPSIMTCGKETSAEFLKYGITIDLQPENDFSARSLERIATAVLKSEDKVLRIRSDKAGEALANKLRKTKAMITDAIIYENHSVNHDELPEYDIVFFSSSSAVINYIEKWKKDSLKDKIILVIGKPTANALINIGIEPDIIANEATVQGAIDSLACDLVSKSLVH